MFNDTIKSFPVPQYDKMGVWEYYSGDILTDFQQALDEGKDVEYLRNLVNGMAELPTTPDKEALADVLFRMLYNAPQKSDFSYKEPDSLSEIRSLRTSFTNEIKLALPSKDVLREKIAGAWLGRICGCMLGQPIECISCGELNNLLKHTNNYPLHRYITSTDVADPYFDNFGFNLRAHTYADMLTDGFPGDDDTNYTVMGAAIIEKYGFDFTTANVSQMWRDTQTINWYATAEKIAYRNAINGYLPPYTALYKNPFREWIGAQIRGDYFGYVCPANPEFAAELAHRDATFSHVKNGIYGEMFVAAMLAGAASLDNTLDVILCGLSQIPSTSRLYERITTIIDRYKEGQTWDIFVENFHSRYHEWTSHDTVHTLSNCELVCAALLWGELDYGKTIGLAVQLGYDTDCNGATAGSVMGMLLGRSAISEEWAAPINNKLHTGIRGYETVSIDDLVTLTMRHIEIQQNR